MSKLVRLDDGRCCGFGNCRLVCPQVFEIVEETNRARTLRPQVPEAFLEAVERAAAECPTHAIEVLTAVPG